MYQTELEYTYCEYRKMQRRIYERNIIIQLIIIVIATPFIIMLLKEWGSLIPYTIGLIAAVVIIKYTYKLVAQNKNGWKLGNKKEVMINKYTFFEHHFEMKNEKEEYYINYHDIYDLIETKTRFYIRTGRYSAFIIKKANCSEELIQFIRKFKRNKFL